LFDVVDFNKVCSARLPYGFGLSNIEVPYYRCRLCGFIFTTLCDDWTPAEFSQFIYNEDYIKVDPEYCITRPARTARQMSEGLLRGLEGISILDYGSGAGVFADELTKSGFADTSSFDPFSSPTRPQRRFDLITCFEVVEHAPYPEATWRDIRSLLKDDGAVVVSTGIQPPEIGSVRANWWYVAPRNGHVSIYTSDAISHMAGKSGLLMYAGVRSGEIVLAAERPAEWVKSLLGRTSTVPYQCKLLSAPQEISNEGKEGTVWHKLEELSGTGFRWTGSDHVQWREVFTAPGPMRAKIVIPYDIEIRRGFVEQCTVEVASKRSVPNIDRYAGTLSAEFYLENVGDGSVSLVTPPPCRPSDVRNSADNRLLGLAIPVANRASV
jgi:2-polyprenyl-6-hydroxyphenyl methylase/3-demethylubiquinone-9 3-methyltransferase